MTFSNFLVLVFCDHICWPKTGIQQSTYVPGIAKVEKNRKEDRSCSGSMKKGRQGFSLLLLFFFPNHFWEPKQNENAGVRFGWHWAGMGRWRLCQDWPGDCSVDGTVYSRSWLPQTNGFPKILSFPFKISCQIFTVLLALFHVKPTLRSGITQSYHSSNSVLFLLLQHKVPDCSQPSKLRKS